MLRFTWSCFPKYHNCTSGTSAEHIIDSVHFVLGWWLAKTVYFWQCGRAWEVGCLPLSLSSSSFKLLDDNHSHSFVTAGATKQKQENLFKSHRARQQQKVTQRLHSLRMARVEPSLQTDGDINANSDDDILLNWSIELWIFGSLPHHFQLPHFITFVEVAAKKSRKGRTESSSAIPANELRKTNLYFEKLIFISLQSSECTVPAHLNPLHWLHYYFS